MDSSSLPNARWMRKEGRWLPACAHAHRDAHTQRPQLTLLYMIELKRMLQYPQTSESFFGEQVPLFKSPSSKHRGDLFLPDFLIVKSLTQETGNSLSGGDWKFKSSFRQRRTVGNERCAHKHTRPSLIKMQLVFRGWDYPPCISLRSTCCVVSLRETPPEKKKWTGWLICVKIPALFKSNGAANRSEAHNH